MYKLSHELQEDRKLTLSKLGYLGKTLKNGCSIAWCSMPFQENFGNSCKKIFKSRVPEFSGPFQFWLISFYSNYFTQHYRLND